MSPFTLTARWLFPADSPPLERGTITIAGDRIVAVEPHGVLTPDRDLGNVAILPGFVNAHTHLDLSGLRGKCAPTPEFTDWLRAVIKHRRNVTPEQTDAVIRTGLEESLRFGTTLLGDIAGEGRSWTALSEASLRTIVYFEMIGLREFRASQIWSELLDWLEAHQKTATCRPGISPHAPYSVRSSLFFGAMTLGPPVAVHLAESEAEIQLLLHRRGPFIRFLSELNVWDPEGLAEDPEHVLRLLNGLSPLGIVHGNMLPGGAPIPKNGTIVYCPRTHAAFGHPPHPFREFLARGVRVALGTDSLASNPDLDLWAEACFVHQRHPDVSGETLLRMATLSGAEALGWADETGSLTPGKSADLVVLPLGQQNRHDPHELILEAPLTADRMVMFRGSWRRGPEASLD